jgi:orotate phosphoribosyltransferase
MITQDEFLQVFRDSGALLDGHFVLSSGLHSPVYLEKFLVLQYPQMVEKLCAEIASRFGDKQIDVVLGPTTGGILLAYETAKHLRVRGIFAESENGKRVLRRGFKLKPGERVLLVDDILTTGSSIRDTIEVIDEAKAELIGIGVLADRSGGSVTFPAPLEAVLTIDAVKYDPSECPQCKAGTPLTKRGTTADPHMR